MLRFRSYALPVERFTRAVVLKALRREKPASRIDRIAVVTDDATRLAIHSDCAGWPMASQEARTKDEIASVEAVNGKGTIADIRRPRRVF